MSHVARSGTWQAIQLPCPAGAQEGTAPLTGDRGRPGCHAADSVVELDTYQRLEDFAVNRMVVHSRIGADGVLHLKVPIGKAEFDKEVQVTIDSIAKPAISQEEWRQFVLSTAGAWQGDLERPEQGEYERHAERQSARTT